jgi:CheY-like chemotaxis protein
VQDRIRILHLEDNLRDAELIESALEDQGVNAVWTRVETPEALAKALQKEYFDLIISDFTFPTFNGFNALETARKCQPGIPFIFVSGTIGEERAVEAMRKGATDYVLTRKNCLIPNSRGNRSSLQSSWRGCCCTFRAPSVERNLPPQCFLRV